MNEIFNKFFLVGDKFMPELHLKQPGFTYSACGPFTRNKKSIEKFWQTVNTDFIYKNELDKACLKDDMAHGKSKDLAKRSQSDKVLRDRAFITASDKKYGGYQRGLALMVYKLFDKKSSESGVATLFANKSATEQNYQLANEISKGRKPKKIWADQRGEFDKKLFKRFFKIINIEMYSKYNEEKSVVAERFIRTMKNKIFKYMATVS